MRKNLLALALVVFLASILSRNAPRTPPKIEWEASFWLSEPNGFGAQWLDIENDRYKTCGTGCTGGSVGERGLVERTSNQLQLTPDGGARRSYILTSLKDGRHLQDALGHDYPERSPEIPRIHPQVSWLREDLPLVLDGVVPGMLRSEVMRLFPRARLDGDGALTVYPYRESPNERVTIVIGRDDRVELVRGIRLSQNGRALLNECSTRRDVECLFGRLSWNAEKPDSFGVSSTAGSKGLVVQVHGLVGMTPDESVVVSLKLSR